MTENGESIPAILQDKGPLQRILHTLNTLGGKGRPDTFTNFLSQTNPGVREQLILNTAQGIEKLLDIAKSWNATVLRSLSTNNEINGTPLHPPDSEKISEDDNFPSTIDFVIHYAMIPIGTTLGIVLNMVGLYVFLSGARRAQVFTLLLSTLLVFNIIFLIFEALSNAEYYLFPLSTEWRTQFHVAMNSAIRFSAISSILMLVTISHVRLCAIRKPFHHNSNFLSWNEKRKIWGKYFFPIILLSVVLTVPVFVEFEWKTEDNGETNFEMRPSSLRVNPVYSFLYVGILNFGLLGVFPTAFLIYMACQMRIELQKNDDKLVRFDTRRNKRENAAPGISKDRAQREAENETTISVRENQSNSRSTASEKQRKGLRLMIRGIIVFVVMHTPRIITTFGEFYILLEPNKNDEDIKNGTGAPNWLMLCSSLSDLFMVMNAALDGVIYLDFDLKAKLGRLVSLMKYPVRHVYKKKRFDNTMDLDDLIMLDKLEKKENCKIEKENHSAAIAKSIKDAANGVANNEVNKDKILALRRRSSARQNTTGTIVTILLDDEIMVQAEEKDEICKYRDGDYLENTIRNTSDTVVTVVLNDEIMIHAQQTEEAYKNEDKHYQEMNIPDDAIDAYTKEEETNCLGEWKDNMRRRSWNANNRLSDCGNNTRRRSLNARENTH